MNMSPMKSVEDLILFEVIGYFQLASAPFWHSFKYLLSTVYIAAHVALKRLQRKHKIKSSPS